MNIYLTTAKVIVHGHLFDETVQIKRAWGAPTKLAATRMAREHAILISGHNKVPWHLSEIDVTEKVVA